jgi:hypothetical protein
MKPFITCSLIVAIAIPSVVVYAQSSEGSNAIIAQQKLARELFRELIEINTTLNVGCTVAAEAMAVRLRAAGFAEDDVKTDIDTTLHIQTTKEAENL